MGHNIDLQWLLGLPRKAECPHCKNMVNTSFEEYDIDCGSPEAKDGIMSLDCQCGTCDTDFNFLVMISHNGNREEL